jgi:hypothetical protein
MKNFKRFIIGLALAPVLAVVSIVGGEALPPSSAEASPSAEQVFNFQGTVTTTTFYQDPFGNPLGQETNQGNITISIKPPNESENNPFHLDIAPVQGETSNIGQVEVHSAILNIVTGESGRRTTLQYWNLQVQDNQFTGVLVNSHNAEAAVVNFLNAHEMIAPGITIPNFFPMAQGTTIVGVLENNQLTVHIEGNVIQGTRPFVADIVAVPVQ